MVFGSRKKRADEVRTELALSPAPEGLRSHGPWDSTEREATSQYLDFGALLIRGVEGMQLQVASEADIPIAVLVAFEGSAVELRVLAASRNGDDWTKILDSLCEELAERKAPLTRQAGIFGSEALSELAAKDEAGNDVLQPARFLGVQGKRWLLRATVLGNAAADLSGDHPITEIIRDVIVRRGQEARMLGEVLPLVIPEQMQASSE